MEFSWGGFIIGFLVACLLFMSKKTRTVGRSNPASLTPLDNITREEILREIKAKRKIEAIKLYREKTGAGLKDSKEAVEAMEEETTQAIT